MHELEMLEKKLSLLNMRHTERRCNETRAEISAVVNEASSAYANVIQEERKKQRNTERERETTLKNKLYRQQQYDADAALFNLMVKGTMETKQRDKEEDILNRRYAVATLQENSRAAVKERRKRADAKRLALKQAETALQEKRDEQKRNRRTELFTQFGSSEASKRQSIHAEERRARNDLDLQMFKEERDVQNMLLLQDTRASQAAMKHIITQASEDSHRWARHHLTLSRSRLASDVLAARNQYLHMATECDALLDETVRQDPSTRRRTQFPGIRRLLAAVCE